MALALGFALVAAACVPEQSAGLVDTGAVATDAGLTDAAPPDLGAPDAGPPDTGAPDAGPPDTGPTLCHVGAPPECDVVQDCEDDLPPPTNCEPCRPYNRAICGEGRCSRPATLRPDDIYTIVLTVAPNVTGVESFAGFVLAEHTSGNRKLTCEDFYEDRVSLDNDCLNVLDTRAYALPQTGDTYAISFGQFASGNKTLFVVYGHRGAPNPRGARLGVSCTEIDVGPPTGNGPYLYSGEPMLRLP